MLGCGAAGDSAAGIAYPEPAGGWGALKALSEALLVQRAPLKGAATLSRMNQPEGFDCPGCAWPDPKHTSSFEFCENGGKAIAWETTSKRCTPEFFAEHTVTELASWNDYDLEMVGRLTHPVAYDAVSAAIREGADVLIIDTAGRLHTQDDLMAELVKVRRVIGKQLPEAPHETLHARFGRGIVRLVAVAQRRDAREHDDAAPAAGGQVRTRRSAQQEGRPQIHRRDVTGSVAPDCSALARDPRGEC